MVIPSNPVQPGATIQGRISWFGGPHDPSAGGTPASGIPITTPGIAVFNRATLGGYWLVQAPNGKQAVVQQTDLGPSPSTSRAIDFTYSSLPHFGYSEQSFPTDAVAKATYLGKTVPASYQHLTPGSTTSTLPAVQSSGQAGYDQAVRKFQALSAFKAASSSNPFDIGPRVKGLGGGDPVLDLLKPIAPNPQDFQTAQSSLQGLAGTSPLAAHPAVRAATSVSHVAGGFLPAGAKYVQGRRDQGRDGQTSPGGPVVAPGDGKVVNVLSDPGGFGPRYPVVHFTSGPFAGRTLYLGHTLSAVRPGQQFRAGSVLSYTGTAPIGNASVPGWFEIGFADSGSPGAFGQPAPF